MSFIHYPTVERWVRRDALLSSNRVASLRTDSPKLCPTCLKCSIYSNGLVAENAMDLLLETFMPCLQIMCKSGDEQSGAGKAELSRNAFFLKRSHFHCRLSLSSPHTNSWLAYVKGLTVTQSGNLSR